MEVNKLQKHLSLLRDEYVKLQNKHAELERKYNLLSSIASKKNQNPNSEDNFISRLLKTIGDLFDKELYRCATSFNCHILSIIMYFIMNNTHTHTNSDLRIKMSNGSVLRAHKFVLDARSKHWDAHELSSISELDMSGRRTTTQMDHFN